MSEKHNNSLKGMLLRTFSFLGWLTVLASIAVTLWINLGPEKPVPDKARQQTGEKVISQTVNDIREKRGEIKEIILLHFANDPSDFFTDTLRKKLNASGILYVQEPFFTEKLRKKLNLKIDGCDTKLAALKVAENEKADGVLWGKIERFESFEEGVILKGSWQLLNLKNGETVCEGIIDVDTSRKVPAKIEKEIKEIKDQLKPLEETAQIFPWYIRFLIFALVILLLPILTITFLRTMVAKRSNGVNAFVLGVYTLIGTILSFFMIGAAFDNIWHVVLFLAGMIFAFLYNVSMMKFALKLES